MTRADTRDAGLTAGCDSVLGEATRFVRNESALRYGRARGREHESNLYNLDDWIVCHDVR